MPVRSDLGITVTYGSTYCLVPICGFLYAGGLVSTSVRTGSYQYIPPCTTLYQGYRIPDEVIFDIEAPPASISKSIEVSDFTKYRYRSHTLQVPSRSQSSTVQHRTRLGYHHASDRSQNTTVTKLRCRIFVTWIY